MNGNKEPPHGFVFIMVSAVIMLSDVKYIYTH